MITRPLAWPISLYHWLQSSLISVGLSVSNLATSSTGGTTDGRDNISKATSTLKRLVRLRITLEHDLFIEPPASQLLGQLPSKLVRPFA